MSARPEIIAAAKWWSNCLRQAPVHDTGIESLNAFAPQPSSYRDFPTEEQIELFETILIEILEADREFNGTNWNEQYPDWNAERRSVSVDYSPDDRLLQALDMSDIERAFTLPIKTRVWVDPGCVKVRTGYQAKVEVIWQKP